MRLVVYADVLVTVNLFVNYALLLCTSLILKCKIAGARLLLGAVVGSVYGLVIFLPDLPMYVELPLRLAASGLIVFASFGYKGFRRFLRCFLTFFAVAFAFGGIMLTLWVTVAPVGMIYNNGAVYFDIDLPVLAVSTVACFTVVSLISKLTARKAPANSVFILSIRYNGKAVSGTALCDTGNSLTEGFSGFPVIIGEYATLKEIMPQSIADYYKNPSEISQGEKIRPVVCRTISGVGLLPSFRPDEVELKSINRHIKTNRVYIAVTENRLAGGEFDFILNSEIFNGENEYEADKSYKFDKKGAASLEAKQHDSLCERTGDTSCAAFKGAGAGDHSANFGGERQRKGKAHRSQFEACGVHSKKI